MMTAFSSWDTITSDDIIQSSPSGIIVTNYNGKVIKINGAAEKLLGLNAREVLGKAISSIAAYKEVFNVIKRNKSGIVTGKNGHKLIASKSILNAGKKHKGSIYTFHDISEIEADEIISMHELNCKLESLIESSHDGIILIDQEKIVRVNNSYLRISGLRKDKVEGTKVDSLLDSPHI
ncbi:MAG: hypothetical protein OHK0032_05410 [Thermodesulfovibrionales bacterium]